MSIQLVVNGKPATINADQGTPLLWVIRDELGLTGKSLGAEWACAVPVPCILMGSPCAPVRRRCPR